jgi:hypothetical protein
MTTSSGKPREPPPSRARSLTALVEEALRQRLAGRAPKTPRKRIRLVTNGSGGVGSGVDLEDTSALLDLMDRIGDPLRR